MNGRIRHVVVAIPARDEAGTILDCLESVAVARRRVGIPVTVAVALDSCTDGTAELLNRRRDLLLIEGDFASVGRARREAIDLGLSYRNNTSPRSTWIAMTDADSVVAPEWLRAHLAAAETADAYVGAVVPRLDDLDERRRSLWLRSHPPGATLGHVHGANLGVRASAYAAIGGFADLTTAEDVDLVRRLRAAGTPIVESERHPVVTSARLSGRSAGGYADHLRGLVDDVVFNVALRGQASKGPRSR